MFGAKEPFGASIASCSATSTFSQPPYSVSSGSFRIFVGQDRTLRFHHGDAGEVSLAINSCSSAGVAVRVRSLQQSQDQLFRSRNSVDDLVFDLVQPAFMTTAFEAGVQKSIHDPFRLICRGHFSREAKDIGIVMLRPGPGLFISDQGGTNAGNFIGGDAHSDTRRANQQSKLHLALGHTVSNSLGVSG